MALLNLIKKRFMRLVRFQRMIGRELQELRVKIFDR